MHSKNGDVDFYFLTSSYYKREKQKNSKKIEKENKYLVSKRVYFKIRWEKLKQRERLLIEFVLFSAASKNVLMSLQRLLFRRQNKYVIIQGGAQVGVGS